MTPLQISPEMYAWGSSVFQIIKLSSSKHEQGCFCFSSKGRLFTQLHFGGKNGWQVSEFISELKMRLLLWSEVCVRTPVLVEDARRHVAHDGILGFVCALENAVQRLQLLLSQARLHMKRCTHNKNYYHKENYTTIDFTWFCALSSHISL